MQQAKGKSAAQAASGLSLLLAVVTFLAMWGGVTLVLTDPHGLRLPPFASTPRGVLASLLLFWVPVGTGTVASMAGLMGLSTQSASADDQRRALVGILLGLIPACLAAAWLAWVLSSTGRP